MVREMKDSGIEWIGEIPRCWHTSKLKYLGRYINGYAFKPEDWGSKGIPIIRIQDLTGSTDRPNFFSGKIDDKYLVKNGDILVSWAATLDAFVWNKGTGWLNQHIFKAVPNEEKIDYSYFFWMIKESMKNMNNDNKHGIFMQHVTLDVFNNFSIPMPPLEEQRKIAAFLDHKCVEIDSVIANTQRTLEEYRELRKAIITKAITKGVRGARDMKDSGSVWFGEIPAEWRMVRLKYMFHIKKDIAGKEGYTVLSITQRGITPKNIESNEGQLAADYSKYQLVEPGDFAMNHMDLLTGWVDISKYDGVTSPDYRVFVLDDEASNKEYYLYMMQMCYFNRIFYGLGQGVSGMGRWRLQADKFLNFYIAVPPAEEQVEIVEALKKQLSEMDALITAKEQLLIEMESYKKSVIYEYVTGKKEVPACQ